MADNDFKYVIQDFSNVYIGSRLSYEELTAMDDTPQRLKSAVFRYIPKEALGQRLCDSLLKASEDAPEYLIFSQLKVQIRVVKPVIKKDRRGKELQEYESKTYSFTDFMGHLRKDEVISPEMISELSFKKLQLMALSV